MTVEVWDMLFGAALGASAVILPLSLMEVWLWARNRPRYKRKGTS